MFSIPAFNSVENVMSTEFSCVDEESNIEASLDKMIKNNERALIVVDKKGNLSGIISMTDIHKVYSSNFDIYKSIKVKDIMSRNVISATKNIDINECRDIMIKNNIGILPIVKDCKVIGILDQNHIRDHLYMKLEDQNITIKYIIGEIKEGICAIDKNGIVILWNKFMEERYNIKAKDLIGNYIKDYLVSTICEKVLRTKEGMSDIYHSGSKDDLYGLVNANPIYKDGEFLGVVCTEVDITEAKRLSNKLEETNNKLEYLQNEFKNLSNGSFEKILGKSYKLDKQKEIAKKVAKTNSSILIFGESGTGKEVFARAIHDYSEREGQFIPVNCGAIPNELFESEIFGYESGAFTGASKKGKAGIFELANNGTVFLDELGELPMNMQAKLLRVIQEKEVRRVGGEKIIKINARIICATNKSLVDMIKNKTFREDLYYRLNVVELNLPPLRERKEDIKILINYFLNEICKENKIERIEINKDATNALLQHRWNGNIRELRNTMETLVVLSKDGIIERNDLPTYIVNSLSSDEDEEFDSLDLTEVTHNAEYRVIKKAMDIAKGNKAKAAKLLNIPRTTLYYKLDHMSIK